MRKPKALFGAKSDVYAEAAGYLCLHGSEVRKVVGERCWAETVPIITSAQPSSTQWREAIHALHDALEAANVPGGLGLRFTMGDGFPAPPAPRSSGWVCPRGYCNRVVLADTPGSAPGNPTQEPSGEPRCTLTGQPMRLVE